MIHPSAIVSDSARLGANVEIGPFCIVEPGAEIGDGTRLVAQATIKSAPPTYARP
jgi:UDP-N-acetylglucosamine acyltransferase